MNRAGIVLLGIYTREKVHPYDALQVNAHGGSTLNSQMVRTAQTSTAGGIDKQIAIYPGHGVLLSNEKDELLMHAATHMNLRILRLSENNQTQESTVPHASVYVKF